MLLLLGDQLSHSLSSLGQCHPDDTLVIMAEVVEEATYVPHHPKKIAFVFSAMRHFAEELRANDWRVDYHDYSQGHSSLLAVLRNAVTRYQPEQLIITEPGEWRLLQQMQTHWPTELGITPQLLDDDRFLCSRQQFALWAQGRKQLRMEYFYRQMRQRSGWLMDEHGQPQGGQWNFDQDNRQRYSGSPPCPAAFQQPPDQITEDVLTLVKQQFSDHFGDLEPFHMAVTHADAARALDQFIQHGLPYFGDYQDAMSHSEPRLFHSLLSPYLNVGLLLPRQVCEAALLAWQQGHAPLNAVEGFIRQILGWREYVRGIYWLTMPDYRQANQLASHRPLPGLYWGAATKMHCVSRAVEDTRRHAHAHHIQRLMVTGNLALLLGVDVMAIHHWYLAVYADAYEWVELPNTLGMMMHADGGLLGSKPYAASGKYIQRMSDYCQHCHYNVRTADNTDSCPFNALYWHFIERHRARFEHHPRMAMIYRSWQKMAADKKQRILNRGGWLIDNIEQV